MPIKPVTVKAQSLEDDGGVYVRLEGMESDTVKPGHLFAGYRSGHDWHCHALIPTRLSANGISVPLPATAHWPPGATVMLRGPLGGGFQPPRSSRRWLLISIGPTGPYLRPLVELGLALGREVAYVADFQVSALPPAVEILSDHEEGLQWADYVAVAIPFDRLDELSVRLKNDAWQLRRLAEDDVLVVGPVPCGIGGCQACALEGHGRRRLPCVEGAVFRLRDLRS